MNHRVKVLLLIFVAVVVVPALVAVYIFYFDLSAPVIDDTTWVDLSQHPIYSTYDFSDNDRVIDVGVQPLWIPTSNIIEVIKRDIILMDALDELGYTIRFHPFLKGNDVNYFLSTGDLEFGIGGDMPAIRLASNEEISIISLIQEGHVSIVSRHIKTINQLKGKKIGYATGSNAHYYLLNTLYENGLEVSDVNLIQLDVTEMITALKDGRIDAFSAWEPTPFIAIRDNSDFIVTHRGKSYGFIYGLNSYMDGNPEIAKLIVSSEIRALRWLRKHNLSDKSSEFVIRAIDDFSVLDVLLTPREITVLSEKDLPGIRFKNYPRINKEWLADDGVIAKEFYFLLKLGLIDDNVVWSDVKKMFDLNIIEEIISNYNKYRIYENNVEY